MMFTVGLGLARSRLPSFFKVGGVDGGYFKYILHCVQPELKHSHALIIESSPIYYEGSPKSTIPAWHLWDDDSAEFNGNTPWRMG